MTNEFYSPGEQRAARVGQLFATIAGRYDFINDIQSFGMHRLWKRRVIGIVHPAPGEQALDLCCGTGDLTLALAKGGADVTGLDFSEAMLRVAKEKLARFDSIPASQPGQRSKPKIEFVQGDALKIPFPDNSFDILTIGYGLRNLADLEAGLREMWRVAKPGGRLVALEFGKPANSAWRAIYFNYLKFALPVFGKLFAANSAAYGYILESLAHYPAQQAVAAKMAELGWSSIRVINLIGGVMTIHYAEKRGQ